LRDPKKFTKGKLISAEILSKSTMSLLQYESATTDRLLLRFLGGYLNILWGRFPFFFFQQLGILLSLASTFVTQVERIAAILKARIMNR